jgi:uncharacterized protein (TIGR03000 family)
MTRKQCILSVALALTSLLAITTASHAQRGGPPGGRPGGGYGGGVYAPYRGGYGGNAYSPYRGGYSSPGISISFGVGGIGYGVGGIGYGVGGIGYGAGGIYPYSAFPSYYPANPYYVSPYLAPRYPYDPPIAIMQAPAVPEPPRAAPEPPTLAQGTAQIRVLVPDGQAQVWFDGAATKQTGTDRYFHTPVLAPGSSNTYRIRASWMEDGEEMIQERVVTVAPGATVLADFR